MVMRLHSPLGSVSLSPCWFIMEPNVWILWPQPSSAALDGLTVALAHMWKSRGAKL